MATGWKSFQRDNARRNATLDSKCPAETHRLIMHSQFYTNTQEGNQRKNLSTNSSDTSAPVSSG